MEYCIYIVVVVSCNFCVNRVIVYIFIGWNIVLFCLESLWIDIIMNVNEFL